MKKTLTFCTVLVILLFITYLANATLLTREKQVCGHILPISPITFWNKHHFCERNNVLAQLQSIQAASRFYAMEHGRPPSNLKTLVDQRYLAISLFENNPVQFKLIRDETGLVLSGNLSKKNMTVYLRMNGQYAITENNVEVVEGSIKDQ